MNDPNTDNRSRRFGLSPRMAMILGGAALLAAGGTASTVAGHAMRPSVEMAPLNPVAIKTLTANGGIVTIRGRVAEVFGNKLVVDDGSARALVDTGREGDDHALATVGAPVTVQGRFDRGFVHASFLVDGAGKVTALGPPAGPPPGGPHGRHGPPPRPGDGPPPPPPGDCPALPPPANAQPPADSSAR